MSRSVFGFYVSFFLNNIHNVHTDTQQQRSLTQSHKAGFRTALRDGTNLHCLVIQFLVGAAFARDRSSAGHSWPFL